MLRGKAQGEQVPAYSACSEEARTADAKEGSSADLLAIGFYSRGCMYLLYHCVMQVLGGK